MTLTSALIATACLVLHLSVGESFLKSDLTLLQQGKLGDAGWTLLGSQTGNLQMEDSMATMQQPADVKLLTNIHNAASAAPVITYTTHEGAAIK